MIFSNINHDNDYDRLNSDVVRCLEYAKNNYLEKYETGRYEIEGNNIFLNIAEYETCEEEDRIWEAHRDYIDIHMMLKGSEVIAVDFVHNLEQGEYIKENDFLPLNGHSKSKVKLQLGDFLVCYPIDAHKTAIKVEDKKRVKKAIFKVRVN